MLFVLAVIASFVDYLLIARFVVDLRWLINLCWLALSLCWFRVGISHGLLFAYVLLWNFGFKEVSAVLRDTLFWYLVMVFRCCLCVCVLFVNCLNLRILVLLDGCLFCFMFINYGCCFGLWLLVCYFFICLVVIFCGLNYFQFVFYLLFRCVFYLGMDDLYKVCILIYDVSV